MPTTPAPTLEQTTQLWLEEAALQITADIARAKLSVTLTTLSILSPSKHAAGAHARLWEALQDLNARGVNLHIYTNRPTPAHPATLNNLREATKLTSTRTFLHWIRPGRLLHAKAWCIDHQILWIGSANLTAAAHNYNAETWIRLDSTADAVRFHFWLHNLAD